MKNLSLAAILAGCMIAAPAVAQSEGGTQAQPATPAATTQPSQPAASVSTTDTASSTPTTTESATGKPLQPPEHEGFWGHLNPFARKKYVQKQTAPIRDRINELDELTAANSKQIKDVDSRAQEGIRQAQQKASEADQHATDAGNRAQAAQQTATQATNRLGTVEQVVGNIDQYKSVNQTEIRFRPGQTVLSQNAKSALDEMAGNLKNQHGYVIQVQGFSSGQGQTAISSSQKMADSVVRYLVLNHDIPMYRIFVVGMGNAPVPSDDSAKTTKSRHASGGSVEVSLMKNDLEQLSAASNGPSTGASAQPQKQ